MYPPKVAMPSPVATATEGSTNRGSANSHNQPEFDDVIEDILNQTDDELSDLHHVDAPSESVYMICGVLIAMLLVALIIVLLAVTISKLRKREEASAAASSDVVAMQTLPPPTANNSSSSLGPHQQGGVSTVLWSYPVFGADRHDSLAMPLPMVLPDPLVTTTTTSHSGFCRGFRRNLRGRWRRLVKRKPSTEVYTIPAELRPQLKQMYVY
ncbi:uncharacterized protein LOC124160746 isoform X2 [Ischnura elegans]|uniref:uncharacterized protein LOC124160746 isoform X2 n=1 Tax=Ischnura elegans TaxID=197161 RepID=UPI001ED8922C|nr:uncharacterized protein LOC124160746 isoform X2 [Ischnura elegans]